jgi:hypothetical protein
MSFLRPIQWYHSQADPICRTVPLKGLSYEIDFENVDENGQILA